MHRDEIETSSGLPLLAAKLSVPAPPPGMVDRPRLRELLDAGTGRPVSLLSASPGSGKTALLSSWVRAGGHDNPLAWLTLERRDEGDRFWSYLDAALRAAGSSAVDGHPFPVPGLDPPDGYLTRLADALARLPRPVVLILDDLHELHDPAALAGLEFLVRHAGQRLRLILSTRVDPRLPLHRWRVSGELIELRNQELWFTPAETAEVLARERPALGGARAAALHAATEGWPAGLRLAVLSLRGCADEDQFMIQFGGDYGSVADYLIAEVLSRQPPDVTEVLLYTSILEGLCAGLIDALTGRTDGVHVLAGLRHANTFLVPLGGPGGWYRYQRLFGDLLLAELHRQEPEKIGELHRRAARWHAASGQPVEALRHALTAQDWACAIGVLAAHWHDLVLRGDAEAPRRTVPAPPAGVVDAEPEVALAYAADRLDRVDLPGAETYLRLADRHRHLLEGDRKDRFTLMTAAFRLAEAQLTGDVVSVQSFAPKMLAGVDTVVPGEAPGDESARSIALTALGSARLGICDIDAAEDALSSGLAAADRAGLAAQTSFCAGQLAVARALRGELQLALDTAQAALATVPPPDQGQPVRSSYPLLAIASVCYQRDQLADAEHHLGLAGHSWDARSEPFLIVATAILRSLLLQARGDLAHAYQVLLDARRGLGNRTPSSYLEHWLAATETDLRTLHGDTDAARGLVTPLLDEVHGVSAPLTLALARAYIHDGNASAAVHALDNWTDDRRAERILWLQLDGGLLEALALHGVGDVQDAHRRLEDVLGLAEPEGCRRIFVQGGSALRRLLVEHLDSGTAHWSMLTEFAEATLDEGAATAEPGPTPGGAFTERELVVLRYLQSALSNDEIAAELYLSVHTVKTHVRNIYRKLGVGRRRDAVRTARELGLL